MNVSSFPTRIIFAVQRKERKQNNTKLLQEKKRDPFVYFTKVNVQVAQQLLFKKQGDFNALLFLLRKGMFSAGMYVHKIQMTCL